MVATECGLGLYAKTNDQGQKINSKSMAGKVLFLAGLDCQLPNRKTRDYKMQADITVLNKQSI